LKSNQKISKDTSPSEILQLPFFLIQTNQEHDSHCSEFECEPMANKILNIGHQESSFTAMSDLFILRHIERLSAEDENE
jgi:hypothetical protein